MHAFHDALPGYDPGNILHDGCEECEERAANPLNGLTSLDHRNFQQAWSDMLEAKWSGGHGLARNVSGCDWRILNALYTIAVLLERSAGLDPLSLYGRIVATSEEVEARFRGAFGDAA